MSVNLLIVSDIKLYCDGLERLLSDKPQVRVIGTAYSRDEGMAALRVAIPDVALVDLAMCESLVGV